jgi:hypothetical protein
MHLRLYLLCFFANILPITISVIIVDNTNMSDRTGFTNLMLSIIIRIVTDIPQNINKDAHPANVHGMYPHAIFSNHIFFFSIGSDPILSVRAILISRSNKYCVGIVITYIHPPSLGDSNINRHDPSVSNGKATTEHQKIYIPSAGQAGQI